MDQEAQIVQRLAQRIPSAKPEKPQVIKPEPSKAPSEILVKPRNYDNDIAALRLLDYFEIPVAQRKDREILDKLNYIYSWASEKVKSDDSVDIMTHIRDLEGRLGIMFKENKLDSLYRWIKLDTERRRIEKELQLWQG
jgi:hypothetical protein